MGVTRGSPLLWCCADVAGQPSVKSYHDSAAQASFATKAVFLIDGIVPLLSHWAFSDIFEEQVRTRQALQSSRHGTLCQTMRHP